MRPLVALALALSLAAGPAVGRERLSGRIACAGGDTMAALMQRWGEAVHALVILKPGQRASAEAIIAHCHTLIAGYKCPRSVEFRLESFPLSGAGKVLKRELRKPYWEGRTRQVN